MQIWPISMSRAAGVAADRDRRPHRFADRQRVALPECQLGKPDERQLREVLHPQRLHPGGAAGRRREVSTEGLEREQAPFDVDLLERRVVLLCRSNSASASSHRPSAMSATAA